MKLLLKILFFIFTMLTIVGEIHSSAVITISNTRNIDMGGRMYDPVLGRFLNPDITVQFPENSQSYNRYSYALNNPLKYTDPSGWFVDWYLQLRVYPILK